MTEVMEDKEIESALDKNNLSAVFLVFYLHFVIGDSFEFGLVNFRPFYNGKKSVI